MVSVIAHNSGASSTKKKKKRAQLSHLGALPGSDPWTTIEAKRHWSDVLADHVQDRIPAMEAALFESEAEDDVVPGSGNIIGIEDGDDGATNNHVSSLPSSENNNNNNARKNNNNSNNNSKPDRFHTTLSELASDLPTIRWETVPESLQMNKEDLEDNIRSLLADRSFKVPDKVKELDENYDSRLEQLKTQKGDDFDINRISLQLSRLALTLRKKNADEKAREAVREKLETVRGWIKDLPHHQEDQIFLDEPSSFFAILITESDAFAVRHGRNNTLSFVDIGKQTAKNLLTPLAYDSEQYRKERFARVRKYDVRRNVEETDFRTVKKISRSLWIVTDANGADVRVTDSWTRDPANLHPTTRAEAVQLWKQNKTKAVRIQPGSYRRNPATNTLMAEPLASLPILFCNDDRKCCIASAIASGLAILSQAGEGDSTLPQLPDNLAADVFEFSVSSADLKKDAKRIHSGFISKLNNEILRQHKIKFVRNSKSFRYDPLKQHEKQNSDLMQLAKLKTIKGDFNHVVAFLPRHSLMVDGNRESTLPLNQRSLETACDGGGYSSLHWSYRLISWQ